MMITYNLLYDWKSQAGSFTLGSFEEVKWIQTVGHTVPGIAKFEDNVVAGPVSPDGEETSFGHSLNRILTKVQDDLLDFFRIEWNQRQGSVKNSTHR